MPASVPWSTVPAHVRRGRWAATTVFFTNGAVIGGLLPRLPEVKLAFDLSDPAYGVVVVLPAIGSIVAAHSPAALLRRFGSAGVSTWGTWMMLTLIAIAGFAGDAGGGAVWIFMAAMAMVGMCDAGVDVAQNAQGLRVQDTSGRSVLTSMHAGWSAGAALGGAIGTGAATLGLPLGVHLTATGVVWGLVVTLAGRRFLPDKVGAPAPESAIPGVEHAPYPEEITQHEEQGTREPSRHTVRKTATLALAPLILIAMAGISIEDIGNNWAALFLNVERGVAIESAGIAVTTVIGAQFIGRVLGDRMLDWLGPRMAVRLSLTLIIIGITAATWIPGTAASLAGFALAGFGSAVIIPVAFAQADTIPGLRPQTGVAVVGMLMRVSTLGLSPVIGAVSGVAGLPIAFSVITVVALLALLVTRVIRPVGAEARAA